MKRKLQMKRYWRSLRSFWRSSLQAEMEYQLNLIVDAIAVVGNLLGSLLVMALLFAQGKQLGGWSWEAATVVLGVYTLLDGFSSCLLQPNLSKIVGHVQNGTLDFVLLKPIDSQFWLSSRHCSPWGVPALLAGLALTLWGTWHSGWHTGSFVLGGALLVSGALILYSLWFLLAALAIWFVKVWNATEVLRFVLVAGKYPISAYPAALRVLFTFVLPVAFLTTVPAEALLGEGSWHWALGSLLMAALFLFGTRLYWLFALRHYTSASS